MSQKLLRMRERDPQGKASNSKREGQGILYIWVGKQYIFYQFQNFVRKSEVVEYLKTKNEKNQKTTNNKNNKFF